MNGPTGCSSIGFTGISYSSYGNTGFFGGTGPTGVVGFSSSSSENTGPSGDGCSDCSTGPTGSIGVIGIAGPISANTIVYSNNSVSVNSTGFYINNIFSSTYDNYHFEINAITGSYALSMALSANGVADTTTNVLTRIQRINSTGVTITAGTSALLADFFDPNQANAGAFGDILTPYLAANTTCFYELIVSPDANGPAHSKRLFIKKDLKSYDGLRLFTTSGTFGGRIQIYGYEK